MTKRILAILALVLTASLLLWSAVSTTVSTYTPGSTAVSLAAGTATTGIGTYFAFPGVYNKYTWQVIVSGGTATAITTNLECSIDGSTVAQYDQSTNTAGETRSVVNKPSLGCQCNITTYTVNGTTAKCQFIASADPR